MDKSPDAFRTISEVGDDLDLPQHVLRFWETRFTQIKPLKRGGGRRYYRPEDVELLRTIRQLLYGEGYTIKGVQRMLKEQGPRGLATHLQDRRDAAAPNSPRLPLEAEPDGSALEHRGSTTDIAPAASGLSREDVRRLQAALFEIAECQRMLDGLRAA